MNDVKGIEKGIIKAVFTPQLVQQRRHRRRGAAAGGFSAPKYLLCNHDMFDMILGEWSITLGMHGKVANKSEMSPKKKKKQKQNRLCQEKLSSLVTAIKLFIKSLGR